MADDLNFQKLNTVQSGVMPNPVTLTGALTIAPTTRLSFVTGTFGTSTITPPVTGYHELVLVFTDATPVTFVTTGNIKSAYLPITNRPIALHYDPATAKYWVSTVT